MPSGRTDAPHDWLLFADQGGIAAGLAARLAGAGDRCILVRPGRFTADESAPSIDPTSATDYRRLLAELRMAGRIVRGVVHAWSLDTASWDGMSAARSCRSPGPRRRERDAARASAG